MQKAKALFYVSAGILALALAFHLGARTAQGQAPGNPIVAADNRNFAYTANGDVYRDEAGDGSRWSFRGNVFSGSLPIPIQRTTWGQIKAERR